MSNSARNGKKQFGSRWKFSAIAAVLLPFLDSSIIYNIKATAKPNLTAVTHFWAEFLRFKEWNQKVAHPPPTPSLEYVQNYCTTITLNCT